MTVLDAAHQVLTEAGTPLHFSDITQRILQRGLWKSTGKTPWATVEARLCENIKRHGPASRFRRAGARVFALNDRVPDPPGVPDRVFAATAVDTSSADASCHPEPANLPALEAAYEVLSRVGEPVHFRDLTRRMIEDGLWHAAGRTPAATVNAEITREIKRAGERARFRRAGRGIVALATETVQPLAVAEPTDAATTENHRTVIRSDSADQRLSFTDAAEQVLDRFADRSPMHYRDVTAKAIDLGLIRTEGQTPDATLYAQVLTEINRQTRRGESPRFIKYGKGRIGLGRWEASGLASQIEQHNRSVRALLLARLRSMPPDAFENLIGDLLGKIGFTEVLVTRTSGDGGIDVRGTLVVGDVIRTRMAVQVKRWRQNLQAPTVQQVRGSLGTHEQGLIITTSDFSTGARTEAERPNAVPVALMNGEQLVKLLVENDIGVRRVSHDLLELDHPGGDDVTA